MTPVNPHFAMEKKKESYNHNHKLFFWQFMVLSMFSMSGQPGVTVRFRLIVAKQEK